MKTLRSTVTLKDLGKYAHEDDLWRFADLLDTNVSLPRTDKADRLRHLRQAFRWVSVAAGTPNVPETSDDYSSVPALYVTAECGDGVTQEQLHELEAEAFRLLWR